MSPTKGRRIGKRGGRRPAAKPDRVPASRAAAPQKSAPATLREVAKLAGVSAMTVSNVINGRFRMMSAKTRRDVEDAIGRLNYRPHSSARSLRLSRRLSVGLMIVDPSPTFIADPFTTFVIAGLGNYLSKRGYALEIQGVAPDRIEMSTLFRWHQSDCLCVVPSGDSTARERLYLRLAELRQPCAIVQDQPSQPLKDTVVVRQDDHDGGWQLARRLLDAGCRRLVYLREVHAWPAMDNREQGIRDAVATSPDATIEIVSAASGGFDDATTAIARYFDTVATPPDAILGGNDQLGIAAVRFLAGKGIAVPEQIRVTGFNAFDFRQYATPTLTSVRSPAYDLGEATAVALLHRLATGSFLQGEVLLPVTIVEGESA